MEFLSSSYVNRLMLEIMTTDSCNLNIKEAGVDLWDFCKSQILSKTQPIQYSDLLVGVESLKKHVSTGTAISQQSLEDMRPVMLKFLECISLVCIKLHIFKDIKLEAVVPFILYNYGYKTVYNKLDLTKINFIDTVPYVDNLYTYIDLLQDNNVKFTIYEDLDFSHIDYAYLSMYLFIFKCSKDDIIVLRKDVTNAYNQ